MAISSCRAAAGCSRGSLRPGYARTRPRRSLLNARSLARRRSRIDFIITERGIDFEAYAAYLATVRNRLPTHVAAFAADARHFAPDAPETLHDAWLVELTVREPAAGMREERRATEVNVRLLGPFHDREHLLRYTGVRRYEVVGAEVSGGHGMYRSPLNGSIVRRRSAALESRASMPTLAEWHAYLYGSRRDLQVRAARALLDRATSVETSDLLFILDEFSREGLGAAVRRASRAAPGPNLSSLCASGLKLRNRF